MTEPETDAVDDADSTEDDAVTDEATDAGQDDADPDDVADQDAAAAADEDALDADEDGEEELAYGCPVSRSAGQRVIHVAADRWRATAEALLADGWNMCVDVTAVDYGGHSGPRPLPAGVAPERFEVVASFVSHQRRERLRARAQVADPEPMIDSLYEVYPGADFLEREVYDMFGITFVGHPDLSRILMPETWDGHPLRKDYSISSIPVQFKAPAGKGGEQAP